MSVTGVLLVGGASRRFGSPKALARFRGQTLAEHCWDALAWCDERLAVGKRGGPQLPFPVLEDESELQAPIVGVVAGLRAAAGDVCVVLPVDCPLIGETELRALAHACRDAAVPQTGPLPGAYGRSALGALERRVAAGLLALHGALSELDAIVVQLPEAHLANVNTPEELAALETT